MTPRLYAKPCHKSSMSYPTPKLTQISTSLNLHTKPALSPVSPKPDILHPNSAAESPQASSVDQLDALFHRLFSLLATVGYTGLGGIEGVLWDFGAVQNSVCPVNSPIRRMLKFSCTAWLLKELLLKGQLLAALHVDSKTWDWS